MKKKKGSNSALTILFSLKQTVLVVFLQCHLCILMLNTDLTRVCIVGIILSLLFVLVGLRRADQNKVSALQSRSPSRKSVAKAAARHPRPAPLHGSARRKATGEHSSPGIGAVDRESAAKFQSTLSLASYSLNIYM